MNAQWKREGYHARCDKHGDQIFRFNESLDRFECPAISSVLDDCGAWVRDGRVNLDINPGSSEFCNADKWGGWKGERAREPN